MNDETLNLSIRSFLKMVGINSQRAIEQAVAKAIVEGTIADTQSLPAKMVLTIPQLALAVEFEGAIKLE
ncbi:MAG: DUF6494 family protein [Betaproteobacteria bacterium]